MKVFLRICDLDIQLSNRKAIILYKPLVCECRSLKYLLVYNLKRENMPENMTSNEQAYKRIQKLILDTTIKPGEPITEVALSERLKIGRTPIREALKKLELEGLIITSNRRKRVYVISVKELEEIFDIKSVLEGFVIETAARNCDAKDCKKLTRILQDMKNAAETVVKNEVDEEKRLSAWQNADRQLHHQLFEMANNSKIENIVHNLDLQWQRLRIGILTLEGRMVRSYEEHAGFVQEVLDHHPEEAREKLQKHMWNVRSELVK